MAEPFVFHFRQNEAGELRQMYVADVRAVCALCRHPNIHRFYHDTPLHPLTAETIPGLLAAIPAKVSFDCPNCGEAVTPECAEAAALIFGFADDSGVIRGWWTRGAEAASTAFELVPGLRLDPQELPGFAPADLNGKSERLDDAMIERGLGRAVSAKVVLRELLEEWSEDPTDGAFARCSPELWWGVASEDASALREEVEADAGRPFDLVVRLADSVPQGLATHRDVESLGTRWDDWLRPDDAVAIADRTVDVVAFVASECIAAHVERTFDTANLTYSRDGVGAQAWFREMKTPRGAPYPRDLSVRSVALRAVHCGLTPGEAARLTAEEIVGTLLGVWTPRRAG